MAIREQLKNRLIAYVEETLKNIKTVRDFCGQEQKWTSEREAEVEKLRDINENQQEENLDTVLKDTLKGLKKLEPFLDAVEKLTLTSCHVFSEKIFLLQGESPESVQSVINAARIDARHLIHFKRNATTFFQPRLLNVNVLIFQLRDYVLKTEQLCERMNKRYKGDPILMNINFKVKDNNNMNQMLDHLKQLCEIREDQDTRLAYLFKKNAQKFIDVFSKRRSRMWQLLSDLEETAVHLDRMKMGASISAVAGSSLGIVGGVLSITGIVLAPFTAGLSLSFTWAGMGLGGLSAVNTLVTDVTETQVNRHHEHNARSYIKSYNDDIIKIEECLGELGNSEGPLVQPSAFDVKKILHNTGEVMKVGLDGATAYLQKSEAATEIVAEDLNTASRVTILSGTEQLANVKSLTSIKAVGRISGMVNAFFIGLDGYIIYEESRSLAKGSETEDSKLIRSRAVLWKSELEAWEEMYNSLRKGIKTIKKSMDTLKKPFLPYIEIHMKMFPYVFLC